ncbi:P-loop containing nucleoside triphosphate hydrolase protein [Dimargaris cristalligena]|uniref:Eukaryotic peptide chain release factor GTP-binding subunit n=1 Tax=Dimargaris cristalligena TaxID=215637 RepID=A0A4P9ZT73_9FUNG|nr:P-loop containing nucleoside triphosphate hydrolase protein [Dimargaris cristalligena]|eukprot:RKP36786.1 P-loop containing nucleoside triphosphate hydrolase protein [Dimargaris cristalligena]
MGINVQAPEFKPSVKAREFVPSWKQRSTPAPAPTATTTTTSTPSATTIAPPPPPAANPEPEPEPEAAPSVVEEPPKAAEAEPEAPKPNPPTPSKASKTPASAVVPEPEPVEEEEAEFDQSLLDENFKEHFNIVFIGHVDAGKSTMGGNILFLTGMVDKRTMEKYEREAREANRESWYLSWALDTNAEERAKGKTVECGRAYFETTKRRYTILDAPGHKNYVPSMIGGAAQADVGVLVISARKGEFETGFERGGQTREHAVLAKTSGVKKLIVVINKMDDPTVQWSKERYDECLTKLSPFLRGAGYNPKTDLEFLPVSGYTGANIKDKVARDVCSWYSGPSLLDMLDNLQAVNRKFNGPLRMPISEKYKDMGTVVVGKVETGHLVKGQNVMLMPDRRNCEVASIHSEENELKTAVCGDNVHIRLRGVEEEDISVGFVMCDTKHPVHAVTAFEAHLVILESKNIICAGYNAILHVHTCVEEVSLAGLLKLVDKKTGRKSKLPPPYLKKNQHAIVRLETSQPIVVETFETSPQLGRFTLRDEGKTIAIGKITRLITN